MVVVDRSEPPPTGVCAFFAHLGALVPLHAAEALVQVPWAGRQG